MNQEEIEILNVKAKEKTKRQLEREKQKREIDRFPIFWSVIFLDSKICV